MEQKIFNYLKNHPKRINKNKLRLKLSKLKNQLGEKQRKLMKFKNLSKKRIRFSWKKCKKGPYKRMIRFMMKKRRFSKKSLFKIKMKQN